MSSSKWASRRPASSQSCRLDSIYRLSRSPAPTESAPGSVYEPSSEFRWTRPCVTLIARLVPIKRVDRFLRVAVALKDAPSVHFLIVGDGELREPLQRSLEARLLGDQLIWAGFRRDMAAIYSASDVVIQTSDNEGTPVSLIEAQAAGVPVVSTRVGGTESVISELGRGFVAPCDDETKLVDAVSSLLADPDLAAEVGEAGKRRVFEHFSLSQLVARTDDLYRDLLVRAPDGSTEPVQRHPRPRCFDV